MASPAAALAALPDDEFHDFVESMIPPQRDESIWETLTDPALIHRTRAVLSGIHRDVEDQLSLHNAKALADGVKGTQAFRASLASRAEWRRKAIGFRRLVQQRLAFVKSRIPREVPQAPGAASMKARYANALETLARAVTRHRDAVLGNTDDDATDDELWAALDTITLPAGPYGSQPLTEWLDFLDERRGEA